MGLKVQHKDLPDNLLHEPKGAVSAAKDTVYIANGAGAGSFKKINLDIVEFTKGTVDNLTPVTVPASIAIDGKGLLQVANNTMVDLPYGDNLSIPETDTINKNFKELYDNTVNTNEIIKDLKQAVTNLDNKVNELLTALKNAGVVNNG